MGLGPDLGYAFWATTCFEGIFGAYTGIWPLWIEHLGAPIAIVGLVLGALHGCARVWAGPTDALHIVRRG